MSIVRVGALAHPVDDPVVAYPRSPSPTRTFELDRVPAKGIVLNLVDAMPDAPAQVLVEAAKVGARVRVNFDSVGHTSSSRLTSRQSRPSPRSIRASAARARASSSG